MSNDVFGDYAAYYDLLYRGKNYEAECDFVEEVFRRHAARAPQSVLDIGCGSGNHALPLARRGYAVTGIDASSGMLKLAREKTRASGILIDFHQDDMRSFSLGRTFDAAVCLFAVISYLPSNDDLSAMLANVKRHLAPGGLLVIESWNGLAVMKIGPTDRHKIVNDGKLEVVRLVSPELKASSHLCRNHYTMLVLENGVLSHTIKETHVMRYLFPQELSYFLTVAGFEVVRICAFPELKKDLDENEWNMAVIARLKEM